MSKVYIISGPSGSGKSTVTKMVRDILNIPLSISVTTRQPRIGEIEGKDYYFLSVDQFEAKVEKGELFEYALVHGNYYGTLTSEVLNNLDKGKDVILEIDVQGAIIAKEKLKDKVVLVFFRTESIDILRARLEYRNTDSEAVIQKRIENAKKELEYEKYYDYVIINKDIDESVEKLINIIKGDKNDR